MARNDSLQATGCIWFCTPMSWAVSIAWSWLFIALSSDLYEPCHRAFAHAVFTPSPWSQRGKYETREGRRHPAFHGFVSDFLYGFRPFVWTSLGLSFLLVYGKVGLDQWFSTMLAVSPFCQAVLHKDPIYRTEGAQQEFATASRYGEMNLCKNGEAGTWEPVTDDCYSTEI